MDMLQERASLGKPRGSWDEGTKQEEEKIGW